MCAFQIVGELPGRWAADLRAFAEHAQAHSWGAKGYERLVVVSTEEGAMVGALKMWMPADEYNAWLAVQPGRPVATGAKMFAARDGLRTAVVLAIPERGTFLGMAAHEYLEAAIDRRRDAEAYDLPTDELLNAHVVATEYIVERARIEISAALRWPASGLDGIGLTEQVDDLSGGLPAMLQHSRRTNFPSNEGWQHWVNIMRVWAMSLGRVHAGSAGDEADLARFRDTELVRETADAWRTAEAALQRAWNGPGLATVELDAIVRDGLWFPLRAAFIAAWQRRVS
jgi:hypothetical protein